jgi:hypothetical protein
MDDVLVAEEIATITDYFNRTAWWHGIDIGRLMDRWIDRRATYGHYIVDSLPTRRCVFEMRRAKHRNPQWKWSQHDLTDVKALAGVIPYVDVVVTERQWAHVFNAGGVRSRYGTKVLSRLADLSPLIM